MNDKELADAIVALGVGYKRKRDLWNGAAAYCPDSNSDIAGPVYAFVRDWRVAGALMEMGQAHFIEKLNDTMWAVRSDKPYGEGKTRDWYENESLPRAICEACVATLKSETE